MHRNLDSVDGEKTNDDGEKKKQQQRQQPSMHAKIALFDWKCCRQLFTKANISMR